MERKFGVCYMCHGSLGLEGGPTIPLPCKRCSARGTNRMHESCAANWVKAARRDFAGVPDRWRRLTGTFHSRCPMCRAELLATVDYSLVDPPPAKPAVTSSAKVLGRGMLRHRDDFVTMAGIFLLCSVPLFEALAEHWLHPLDGDAYLYVWPSAAASLLEAWVAMSIEEDDVDTVPKVATWGASRIFRILAWRALIPVAGVLGFVLREVAWAAVFFALFSLVFVRELSAKMRPAEGYWRVDRIEWDH